MGDDTTNCVLAFVRQTIDLSERLVVVVNLTPTPHTDYQIGVPVKGFYKELLNTDAEWYGGSGIGNQGGVYANDIASHGQETDHRNPGAASEPDDDAVRAGR